MKNVLLLGDSIRMIYQPLVKAELLEEAEVYGPEENGRWSGYTLNSLRFWLPAMKKPDIVHWNNGLWDLGDDYHFGRHFTTPEEYEWCASHIVLALRQLCCDDVKIIFATITPTKHGDLSGMIEYNEIIKRTASKYSIPVNDLFTAIAADRERYIGNDGLHLSPEGAEIASKLTVGEIRRFL